MDTEPPPAAQNLSNAQDPWNMGHTCYICYSHYDKQYIYNESLEYRDKVLNICEQILFTEILGDKFDWSILSSQPALPFCQECWDSIENIYKLFEIKESAEKEIADFLSPFAYDILISRRRVRRKLLSSIDDNVQSLGYGIKVEGMRFCQNIKCKMCLNIYSTQNSDDLIPLDNSAKVIRVCSEHIYPELIDEKFYDWKSIPYNNYVPLCSTCSQGVKKFIEWDEKIVQTSKDAEKVADLYTLRVLKRRRKLKKLGVIKNSRGHYSFRDDGSIRDDASMCSMENVNDLDDEDCHVVYESIQGPHTSSSQQIGNDSSQDFLGPSIVSDPNDVDFSIEAANIVKQEQVYENETEPVIDIKYSIGHEFIGQHNATEICENITQQLQVTTDKKSHNDVVNKKTLAKKTAKEPNNTQNVKSNSSVQKSDSLKKVASKKISQTSTITENAIAGPSRVENVGNVGNVSQYNTRKKSSLNKVPVEQITFVTYRR